MLTFEKVRDLILAELRHKGYAPNPADVHGAVDAILTEHKNELEIAAGESLSEAKKLASASVPLITVPSSLRASVTTPPAK